MYDVWKKTSGEYDPKDDKPIVDPRGNVHTQNETKFKYWAMEQYGMTAEEYRGYTVEGTLKTLEEIDMAKDKVMMILALPSMVKNAAKTVKDVANGVPFDTSIGFAAGNDGKKQAQNAAGDVAEETTKEITKEITESNTVRVGRWMSQTEYDQMVKSGKVQMSKDNKTHVANPADINAFGKQAPKGSLYVEFDVSTDTMSAGGTKGWSIINGPGSLIDRLRKKKGLPPITEMPDVKNIEIKGSK